MTSDETGFGWGFYEYNYAKASALEAVHSGVIATLGQLALGIIRARCG